MTASDKAPALNLTSDRVLFVNLAKLASDWTFRFLEVAGIVSLSLFDIQAVTAFEERSFEKQAKAAEETSRALQALSGLLGKTKNALPIRSRRMLARLAGNRANGPRLPCPLKRGCWELILCLNMDQTTVKKVLARARMWTSLVPLGLKWPTTSTQPAFRINRLELFSPDQEGRAEPPPCSP